VVVVIEGASEAPGDLAGAVERANELVAVGERKRDAARRAGAESGVSANAIYRALLGR
jgi:hypothetical protein